MNTDKSGSRNSWVYNGLRDNPVVDKVPKKHTQMSPKPLISVAPPGIFYAFPRKIDLEGGVR